MEKKAGRKIQEKKIMGKNGGTRGIRKRRRGECERYIKET